MNCHQQMQTERTKPQLQVEVEKLSQRDQYQKKLQARSHSSEYLDQEKEEKQNHSKPKRRKKKEETEMRHLTALGQNLFKNEQKSKVDKGRTEGRRREITRLHRLITGRLLSQETE